MSILLALAALIIGVVASSMKDEKEDEGAVNTLLVCGYACVVGAFLTLAY